MIELYHEFNSTTKTLEFPKLSHNFEDSDLFIPSIRFLDGSFIEMVNGKGDAFSYVSGQPVEIIHSHLINKSTNEAIYFKIHSHWHYIPFNHFKDELMPKILEFHRNKLVDGNYYTLNTSYISGKIFKFIDENGYKFEFFAMTGEWIDCQPTYLHLIRRFLSIIKSHYYKIGNYNHWKFLKTLNFYNIKVTEI